MLLSPLGPVIVGAVGGLLWAFHEHLADIDRRRDNPPRVRKEGLWLAGLLLLPAIFFPASLAQVGAGQRGVVLSFGAVTSKTLGEGLRFKKPFIESVVRMSVQVQAHKLTATAASKDLQDVSTEVTINFRLRPERVNLIYQTLREDYLLRVVDPGILEAVKAVTALYDAEQLITQRAKVRDEIDTRLDLRLEEHGIFVEQVNITDFDFSETFNDAIEAKVTASQQALQALNILQRIKTEADQVRARAAGERDAAIAQAEGQAEAIRIRAEAQSKANDLISRSLTSQLIQWQTVQQLADDIRVIVLPAGQQFILGEQVIR